MARRKKFRAWWLVLLLACVFLIHDKQWLAAAGAAVALVFYLLAIRRTECRVETTKGKPCPLFARGLAGSCKYHVGMKRGLPSVKPLGTFGMPRLIWLRGGLPATPRPVAQSVAVMREVGTDLPERGGRETAMLWLAVGGVVVAFASFLRDLIAG